ncbi:MAG: hypothetical protein K0R92_3669 [Lachnospiraceae bacterium]|nr:hypothetical protein [Lachnospiraceae bacterium]
MIVDERITAYINSLGMELTPELLSLEKEALEHHVPIIKKETQGVLKFLLRMQQPKRILEVGTAIGFSALFMSEYTRCDSTITTIEKVPMRMKLLADSGLLVTDNVLQDGTVTNSRYSITRRDRTIHSRMREYLHTITHMEELETTILPVGDGIALSYRTIV